MDFQVAERETPGNFEARRVESWQTEDMCVQLENICEKKLQLLSPGKDGPDSET